MTHIPGHIGTAGGGDTLVGNDLFDPNTGAFVGKLIKATAGPNAGKLFLIVRGSPPARFTGGTFLTGQNTLVTLNNAGVPTLAPRNLPFDTGGTGGGGTSAPAFSSTQAAQTQAEAAAAAGQTQAEAAAAAGQTQAEAAAAAGQTQAEAAAAAAQTQAEAAAAAAAQAAATVAAEAALAQTQADIDAANAQTEAAKAAAVQAHQNALAILEQQLVNATGLQAQLIQSNIDLENQRHENDLVEIQINFDNQMEQLQLQFENQMKQTLIGEIGAERRTLITEKGRAQERQVERAGQDPFRFAFNVRGQQAPTLTPEDIFKREQMAFINQPLPQANLQQTIPELEAILGQSQGLQAPTGGFLGLPSLAHGGVIEMARGSDGAFSRVPVIVGDEGPELALLPSGAEIIPLNRNSGLLNRLPKATHGAQVGRTRPDLPFVPLPRRPLPVFPGGPTIDPSNIPVPRSAPPPPFTPFAPPGTPPLEIFPGGPTIDPSLIPESGPRPRADILQGEGLQALLGLANLPFLKSFRESLGLPGTGPLGVGAFGQLGVQEHFQLMPGGPLINPALIPPELIRTTGDFVPPTPSTGRLPAFQASAAPLTLERGLLEMGVPDFQAKQISDQFGPFPSPFKLAPFLPSLLPAERGLFNSLYSLMGFTPEDINAQVSAATLRGPGFRGAVGIG